MLIRIVALNNDHILSGHGGTLEILKKASRRGVHRGCESTDVVKRHGSCHNLISGE